MKASPPPPKSYAHTHTHTTTHILIYTDTYADTHTLKQTQIITHTYIHTHMPVIKFNKKFYIITYLCQCPISQCSSNNPPPTPPNNNTYTDAYPGREVGVRCNSASVQVGAELWLVVLQQQAEQVEWSAVLL